MTNSTQHQALLLQDRYGLLVASRLSEGLGALPHDVTERLRAARIRALSNQKLVRAPSATLVRNSWGSAALGFDGDRVGFWGRFASALPLIALAAGLVAINVIQNEHRAQEVADVDAALLTDDLPPAAYVDPGFAQFLRAGGD